jgi:hypothetical protein
VIASTSKSVKALSVHSVKLTLVFAYRDLLHC